MRCKACDYQLWNIATRQCPECSLPFRPSNYRFVPGRVQFLCPYCRQVYYGTGESGHLEPLERDCIQCGHLIRMDEMVLCPVDPNERCTITDQINPWTRRREVGRFKAFFKTAWRGAVAPSALMDGTLTASRSVEALGFAWTIITLISFASFGVSGILLAGPIFIDALSAWSIQAPLGFVGYLAGSWVTSLVFFGLAILIIHGILRITGKLHGGLGNTVKAVSYTTGPLLMMAVPACGVLFVIFAAPWWYIGATFALVRVHQVHPMRAILAILVLPAIPILLLLSGISRG